MAVPMSSPSERYWPADRIATTSAPAYQAYRILQVIFCIAPIIAGIDKFTHLLVNWDMYLAPIVPQMLHIDGHLFMQIVGVIEICAGLLVAWKPRIFGYLVMA